MRSAPVTLESKQVARIAGFDRSKTTAIARLCKLEHLAVGTGHAMSWSIADALTVAFVRALVIDEGYVNRGYAKYVGAARRAAEASERGDPPGWIVETERGVTVWAADEGESLALELLACPRAARVLRCAPILERLNAEIAAPRDDRP